MKSFPNEFLNLDMALAATGTLPLKALSRAMIPAEDNEIVMRIS